MKKSRKTPGAHVDTPMFTATDAKNEFGRVLEMVMRGERVFITKHDAPKAVILSIDDYNTLAHSAVRELDTLRDEFDALLAGMQTPEARHALKAAFEASPQELGKAAVAAAIKRG